MFVEEADVCVRLLKSLIILLVETACCGNKEEDVEEPAQDAVLVAMVEKCGGGKEDGEIDAHEGPKPRCHLLEIGYHKD